MKTKYRNRKVHADGKVFDSKLEHYCYSMLKILKVEFKWQYKYQLQPSFTDYTGKKIRAVNIIIDFVIEKNGILYIIDTKGFHTPLSNLKYKLLGFNLMQYECQYEILMPSTKKEVNQMLNEYEFEK